MERKIIYSQLYNLVCEVYGETKNLLKKLKEEWIKESPDPILELTDEFQISETSWEKDLNSKGKANNRNS